MLEKFFRKQKKNHYHCKSNNIFFASRITERLMEDLFNEVFSDTHTVLDKIVEELIIEESKWLELYKMFLKKRKPR